MNAFILQEFAFVTSHIDLDKLTYVSKKDLICHYVHI